MSDTLPAGRELDALVAEKVMGWTVIRDDPRDWIEVVNGARTLTIAAVDRYSTDIAAAWEVVAHYNADRWYAEVTNDADGLWWCRIGSFEPVRAETAPHAICLAALNAVGARALQGEDT